MCIVDYIVLYSSMKLMFLARCCGFPAKSFVALRCLAPQLLRLGFSAAELRAAELSARSLRRAGQSPKEK